MAVRQATASDLGDLTQILIASSNDDPCYPYRFPWKDDYPTLYEEHCRRKCREYLVNNTVDVYEIASPPRSGREKKVVAFGVWEQPKDKVERSQTWPRWGISSSCRRADDGREARKQACSEHRQPHGGTPRPKHTIRTPSVPQPFAREDRCRGFREAGATARASLLDSQYAGGYMFLKILLCHPDYRRRGAGTALVNRGTAAARCQGVNTALFSSPMGLHLYRKLGFQEIGRFEVEVEADDERLDIPAMVFPPPSPMSRRKDSVCGAEVVPSGLRRCVTNNNVMVAQKV